jgi:cyclin B
MVVDLADDIMSYWKTVETRRLPHPQYMQRQTDLTPKMREILIDWLVEVHHKFTLSLETLYLAINLVDRFLERRAVSRGKLQLVGCTAMLLASKYEEICVPVVKDFVHVADNTYSKEQILAMEGIILSALQFNLTTPSPLRFAQRYLTLGRPTALFSSLIHSSYYNEENRPSVPSRSISDDFYQYSAFYFIELTLQDYRFLCFLPSLIAASGVYLALIHTGGDWTPSLEEYTGYSLEDMRVCVTEMCGLATQVSKYRAVKKKYALKQYFEVSKQEIRCPFK